VIAGIGPRALSLDALALFSVPAKDFESALQIPGFAPPTNFPIEGLAAGRAVPAHGPAAAAAAAASAAAAAAAAASRSQRARSEAQPLLLAPALQPTLLRRLLARALRQSILEGARGDVKDRAF
jgi:hypothetical protein